MRLDKVAVGAEAIMGQPGGAASVLESLLVGPRACGLRRDAGAARRCLDMSVEYVKVREQFGQPIALPGHPASVRRNAAEGRMRNAAVYYAALGLTTGAEDAPVAPDLQVYVTRPRGECAATPSRCRRHRGSPGVRSAPVHEARQALEPLYGDTEYQP